MQRPIIDKISARNARAEMISPALCRAGNIRITGGKSGCGYTH